MSIEEDITKVLAEWHAEPADPEAWQVAMFEDAVVRIMPLVKRAQAEALREAARGCIYPIDPYGGFDQASLSAARIQITHWLRDRAEQIEREGAGA